MAFVPIIDEEGAQTVLSLDTGVLKRFTRIVPSLITLQPRSHPARCKTERFIERSYEEAYGCRLAGHYPTLMSVEDRNGNLIAAAGTRRADEEPLFLEQYLHHPVEHMLSNGGMSATRDQIAEIGTLASSGLGASIFVFAALSDYLMRQRRTIAVATATSRLRRIFNHIGLDLVQVGRATSDALPDRGISWGSYYRSDPVILAGSVSDTCFKLRSLLTLQEPVQYLRSQGDARDSSKCCWAES